MPISDNLARNGTFRPEKRAFYGQVIRSLEGLGLHVECAALNEDWGRTKLPPVQFTDYDLAAIQRSDLLVLVTCERLTRDMYLEMGLMLSRNKPVVLFIPASAHVTFMVQGLEQMAKIKIVTYDAEADVPNLIDETLPSILALIKQRGLS